MRRLLSAARRLHLAVGLLSAVYFLLIAFTGVAMNHREALGLESRYVSRQWLPLAYRADDGAQVRSDIVISDLHSGLIFGRYGAPMLDVVAAFWCISLFSGLSIFFLARRRKMRAVMAPSPARTEDSDLPHLETVIRD